MTTRRKRGALAPVEAVVQEPLPASAPLPTANMTPEDELAWMRRKMIEHAIRKLDGESIKSSDMVAIARLVELEETRLMRELRQSSLTNLRDLPFPESTGEEGEQEQQEPTTKSFEAVFPTRIDLPFPAPTAEDFKSEDDEDQDDHDDF